MASVVDELVVRLGLDNKEFKKGAKETEGQLNKVKGAAATTSKNLQEHGKKGAEFFTQLQKSAIKFFGVMAVGTAAFRGFANLISSGAHLSRLATNLGTTANSLHKWGQAVKQSGGTAQGFEATIRGLSAEITAWKTGGTAGPMLQGLQALGVSLVDTGGKAKSLETLLLDMGEAVQRRAPNRADQANLLAQWGLDEGTINLVLKRRKDAEALIASQPGMDNEAAQKAQDINERWLALVEQVRGKFRELAIQHFPAIERIVLALVGAFERISPIVTTIVEGFTKLNDLTDGWLGKVLMALVAFKLLKGVLPGAGAAGGAAGAVAGSALGASVGAAVALKGDTAPDQQGASALMAKVRQGDRDAAMQLAKIQLNNQFWRFGKPAGEDEIKKRAADLLSNAGQGQSMSGKVTQFGGAASNQAPASSTRQTRAERNNNPGNLNFARQEGAVLESGAGARFAKFNTVEEGIAALVKQLQRYQARGVDTISKIMEIYAPRSENNTDAYISAMTKWTGLGASQALDFNDPEILKKMISGISKKEGRYTPLTENQILSGINLAGVSGGSAAGSSITIGKIDIQTAATDAAGVARSLRDSLVREMNYGTR